jgi:hypothetical protein
VFLRDWETRLDDFLRFNDREVLPGAGPLSKADADEHARDAYERFAARRSALREVEGERASIAALANAARRLDRGPAATNPADVGQR